MKHNFKLSLMLISLFYLSTVVSEKTLNPYFITRRIRLGIAPLSLAHLLKKLGARDSIMRLATNIHINCGSRTLLRHWIRIVLLNRKVFSRSSKHPFTLRRFWYIHHKHRKGIIRSFLKSFIKCGRVPNAKTAFRKMLVSYAATTREKKYKLLKQIQRLKKVFFRKKRLNRNRHNRSIYPSYLLKKIIRLRRYAIQCLRNRIICRRFERHCARSRVYCNKASQLKRRINPSVRKIFVKYFSSLWYNYISTPSMSRIKIYIVRRYRRKYDTYNDRN